MFVQPFHQVGHTLFPFRTHKLLHAAVSQVLAVRLRGIRPSFNGRLVAKKRHYFELGRARIRQPRCTSLPQTVRRALRQANGDALIMEPVSERRLLIGSITSMGDEEHASPWHHR